jgi:hypothetical protein
MFRIGFEPGCTTHGRLGDPRRLDVELTRHQCACGTFVGEKLPIADVVVTAQTWIRSMRLRVALRPDRNHKILGFDFLVRVTSENTNCLFHRKLHPSYTVVRATIRKAA